MKRKPTEADILMWLHLKELRREFVQTREFRFCPPRKWRFDYAVYRLSKLSQRIGIEIEGGSFTQGRHTRGVGFINDMEKYNYAALLGWRVLRFTPQQVLKGEAIAFIRKVLEY